MSLYRLRFGFRDGAWFVSSIKSSNEFATRPIQKIEEKTPGQKRLPILADREPHEFACSVLTPYTAICCYLDSVPTAEKAMRARMIKLAAEVHAL